jgi:hypothetical protein
LDGDRKGFVNDSTFHKKRAIFSPMGRAIAELFCEKGVGMPAASPAAQQYEGRPEEWMGMVLHHRALGLA